MRKIPGFAPAGLVLLCLFASYSPYALAGKKKTGPPVVRWSESTPGCTFDRGQDGMYRWGLWTSDLGITLAVDSQELEKAKKRIQQPMLLLLTFKYRGAKSMDVSSRDMSLEFVRHSKVVITSLDPEDFSAHIQANTDQLEHQTERDLKKHPEQNNEKQAQVQNYLRDATEFQDFLNKNALHDTKLDAGNPETTGWVGFSTRNKWIGDWKKQEEFVLRIPLEDHVVEFPFKLPPEEGDLILRERQ
ncbi:MAG TPA: hypothetical protein VJQ82_09080 [Terriglobales bacterium]|nr:hypothetical protein [Terriglobales bacterium]